MTILARDWLKAYAHMADLRKLASTKRSIGPIVGDLSNPRERRIDGQGLFQNPGPAGGRGPRSHVGFASIPPLSALRAVGRGYATDLSDRRAEPLYPRPTASSVP